MEGFHNKELPIKFENISVKNLNMTAKAAETNGSINQFRFLEVDSHSVVEMKKIQISQVESASNGLIIRKSSNTIVENVAVEQKDAVHYDLIELST